MKRYNDLLVHAKRRPLTHGQRIYFAIASAAVAAYALSGFFMGALS